MIKQDKLEARYRLRCIKGAQQLSEISLAEAVNEGFSRRQKSVPSRFFYDKRGSELFEEITELPEYYLTRCEQSILDASSDSIINAVASPCGVIELGSGSSKKTRLLIEAALRAQPELEYSAVDISEDFLLASASALLCEYDELHMTAISAEYFSALKLLPRHRNPQLFLFLGSNIGNFEDVHAVRFLKAVRSAMKPSDALLIGIDIAKDRSIIEPAYNDAAGITAAFNKNLLVRINEELDGDFELDLFEHEAPYLPELGRVEMRLVSTREQNVWISAIDRGFSFRAGEYIHTENSRKYSEDTFSRLVAASGFATDNCWFDEKEWFGLFILRPSK